MQASHGHRAAATAGLPRSLTASSPERGRVRSGRRRTFRRDCDCCSSPRARRAARASAAEPDLRCPPGTKLWEHQNGSEARCETPAGVAEGPTYGRYRDGTLRYHGTSHAGKTNGTWTNWNANGTVSIEAEYRDGELAGAFRRYDTNGVLQSEGNHDQKGRMDGTWTRYWPNGNARTRWTMDGGRQHGPVATFYESGAKKSEGQRKDGQPDGEWRWFDTTGTVTETCRYDSGRVVDGSCGGPGTP